MTQTHLLEDVIISVSYIYKALLDYEVPLKQTALSDRLQIWNNKLHMFFTFPKSFPITILLGHKLNRYMLLTGKLELDSVYFFLKHVVSEVMTADWVPFSTSSPLWLIDWNNIQFHQLHLKVNAFVQSSLFKKCTLER